MLTELEALDQRGNITATGKEMARLPLHPRLAHMLVAANQSGADEIACRLAGLLSERDPLKNAPSADIEDRLRLLTVFQQQGAAPARALGGDPDLCRRILQAAAQWQRLLPKKTQKKTTLAPGALLSLAYPDRIGRQRASNNPVYLLANGRAARLREHDPLSRSPWLVAPELDAGISEGRIYLAAPIDLAEIEASHQHRIKLEAAICWDERKQAVTMSNRRTLGSLTLAESVLAKPDPELVRAAMLEGIRQMGIDCLPWDPAAREPAGKNPLPAPLAAGKQLAGSER